MITDFASSQHLNFDFNGASYSGPITWHVGFRQSGTELTGNGYARTPLTADTTNFPTTATNVISNGVEFDSATASGGDWIQADEVALYDAASGGNLWYWDLLDAPFTLAEGRFRTFAAGSLQIRML